METLDDRLIIAEPISGLSLSIGPGLKSSGDQPGYFCVTAAHSGFPWALRLTVMRRVFIPTIPVT